MGVITVSRQLGSHGGATASEVAQRLDYRLVDREIVCTWSIPASLAATTIVEAYRQLPTVAHG